MATSLVLTFANPVNDTIQIGDVVYYSTITNGVTDAPTEVGSITAYTNTTVTCSIDASASTSGLENKFYFFAKDNKANLSSLKGYFAEVVMSNDSHEEIELFAVGSEISINSK